MPTVGAIKRSKALSNVCKSGKNHVLRATRQGFMWVSSRDTKKKTGCFKPIPSITRSLAFEVQINQGQKCTDKEKASHHTHQTKLAHADFYA
jgi:hypothetical protein